MTLSKSNMQKAGRLVSGWKRPLLLTHERPDGDALGCLVAMRSVLRPLGADPLAVTLDPVPPRYGLLVEAEPLPVWGETVRVEDLADVDGVLVLDTCTFNQLASIADWLGAATCPKVAVDHHLTRDELANVYLIDESAAAACEILYEWSRACGWPTDAVAAKALFVGLATDTGWFRFSNTRPRTLEIAADLIRSGVAPDATYRRLFESESAERVRLWGAAMGAIELYNEGRLAVMSISRQMLTRTGAHMSDTENVVNEALRIATVQVAVLLAEADGGVIKVSLRSKGSVDVAALAERFGGGGHARAAGARIAGRLAEVKKMIIDEVTRLSAPKQTEPRP